MQRLRDSVELKLVEACNILRHHDTSTPRKLRALVTVSASTGTSTASCWALAFAKYELWKILENIECCWNNAETGYIWKCMEMPWNAVKLRNAMVFAIVLVCVAHVVSAHSTSHNSCLACLADFFQQFLYLLWVVGSGESQRVTKDSGVFRHSHFQWLSNPILSQLSHAKSRSDAKSC